VLVTHDLELASYSSRRITLKDGVIVSDEYAEPAGGMIADITQNRMA
jgi:ABC-type lipoprotein export system ATPase subunit